MNDLNDLNDDEDDDDFDPWTPAGAVRLQEAADRLAAAVLRHAREVVAAGDEAGFPAVLAAHDALLPAVLAYADAHFDYTGNGSPFGALHEWEDEDDDPADEAADAPVEVPTEGISVLARWDFAVADLAALLAAGREAYRRVWPEDDATAAAADVNHLGRAVYQCAHADGWESLTEMPGLVPTGGVIEVREQDRLLGDDPEHWPEAPFLVAGAALHQQQDVWAR